MQSITCLVAIFFCTCVLGCLGQSETLTLYTAPDCQGFYVKVDKSSEDLGKEHDISTVKSVRGGEKWVFYNSPNFVSNGDSGFEFVTSGCYNIKHLSGNIHSARYIAFNDSRGEAQDTLMVFGEKNFQGQSFQFTLSSFNFPLVNTKSLIITGKKAWTAYDKQSFAGIGICLQPNDSSGHRSTFMADLLNASIPIPYAFIKSVKSGCDE